MKKFWDSLQEAVKKETAHAARNTVIGVIIMWAAFGVGHLIWPSYIPFDYRVILAGIVGGAVASLNFFLMAVTVQKVMSMQDEADAKKRMQVSYNQRMMMQALWCVLAIVLPCFQFAAGMLPLLFPTLAIKLRNFWQLWGPKKTS